MYRCDDERRTDVNFSQGLADVRKRFRDQENPLRRARDIQYPLEKARERLNELNDEEVKWLEKAMTSKIVITSSRSPSFARKPTYRASGIQRASPRCSHPVRTFAENSRRGSGFFGRSRSSRTDPFLAVLQACF